MCLFLYVQNMCHLVLQSTLNVPSFSRIIKEATWLIMMPRGLSQSYQHFVLLENLFKQNIFVLFDCNQHRVARFSLRLPWRPIISLRYAHFSGKKRTSLYISREKGVHYYIQTRHNDLFFGITKKKTCLSNWALGQFGHSELSARICLKDH